MTRKIDDKSVSDRERPVSLAPLDFAGAMRGLLAIPDPDATRPNAKRKKAPPTSKG